MTTKEFQTGIVETLDAVCDGTQDKFIAVFFSRSEDRMDGSMSDSVDALDAIMVIRHLIRETGIDPNTLAEMIKSEEAA